MIQGETNVCLSGLGGKCGSVRRSAIKSFENQKEMLKLGVITGELQKVFEQTDLDECSVLDKNHLENMMAKVMNERV